MELNLDTLAQSTSGVEPLATLTSSEVNAWKVVAELIISRYPLITRYDLIGSALYLPNPHDVDYLIYAQEKNLGEVLEALELEGFDFTGAYNTTHDGWIMMRREALNFIITYDAHQYELYLRAMLVCKALNLTDKNDRRLVCRMIRDGMTEEQARQVAMQRGEVVGPQSAVGEDFPF